MHDDPEVLKHEESIVWTEGVEGFDYVRETLVRDAATRRRAVPWPGPGRRVGYSVLRANAPSGDGPGMFTRRVFWVKEYDRSEYGKQKGPYRTGTPSEGVDPRTVKPGTWGEQTDRAWGAPLPSQSAVGDEQRDTVEADGRKDHPQTNCPTPRRNEGGSDLESSSKQAFADRLNLHEASLSDVLGTAAGEAFSDWLQSHSEELKHAIGEAVAQRILSPGLRRPDEAPS
ncbi:DUF6009 family protein [Streptomyces pinistramenti]|uniref:DUF6009 family protein n=1 Tax=Streptomyces pinistramenti TaxID=2884812 RepID=UPI001D093D7D|nr:DUF6009 family protein [Streptomyces pinistramenti]MCB5910147.1 DUF6009 family protein [Streptomyces pinistramenti]